MTQLHLEPKSISHLGLWRTVSDRALGCYRWGAVSHLLDIPTEPPVTRFAFPNPKRGVGRHGIVCFGGDFAPGTLLAAYRRGIFPWPSSNSLVPWCSPDPRAILPLEHRPTFARSLQRAMRVKPFRITMDQAFLQVIQMCGERPEGTWITEDLVRGYTMLHELGWAHSLEVWNTQTNALVGGIYGIAVGSVFTGESMFHRETDASKVAFASLANRLHDAGYLFIDVQLMTPHLASLGCQPISRDRFLEYLSFAVNDKRTFPKT